MTVSLGHDHQIVALTTSLPANIYTANWLVPSFFLFNQNRSVTGRGAAVWAEFHTREETKSESSNGSQFEEAHWFLTYRNPKIGNMRVNG